MKRYRGWIILLLVVVVCGGIVCLVVHGTAEYPALGERASYPVNQVEDVVLTIEEPSWSLFKGYTIRWKVTAASSDIYHFIQNGEAPNRFEYLEYRVDGQWYRLGYTQKSFPFTTIDFALGGDESASLEGTMVQKYAYYGTRLNPGSYRIVLEMKAEDGTPCYLAAEFDIE